MGVPEEDDGLKVKTHDVEGFGKPGECQGVVAIVGKSDDTMLHSERVLLLRGGRRPEDIKSKGRD